MDIKKLIKEDVHKLAKAVWHKHEEHAAGDAKKRLNKSDVIAITLMTLSAAILITFTDFIIYLRWSTFSSDAPFVAYHPLTPWLLIAFNLIYIFCLSVKKITFWLAYYPAVIAIIYYMLQAAFINNWLHPQDLVNFFSMFGLGHPPATRQFWRIVSMNR
jgi:hypothetical protein